MVKVLVVAEHDGRELNVSTARTVACARLLEPETLDVAVLASEGENVARQAAGLEGVSRVILVGREENAHPLASMLVPQIEALATDYTHFMAPGTTFGRDLMPRLAAVLDVPQISDVMAVEGPSVFVRPIYAGNALVTVEAPPGAVVATVRTASFAPVAATGDAPVEKVTVEAALPPHTRFRGFASSGGARPDLQSARRVVAGGRGVGSETGFELIFRLADRLGAAVGASRAAVDAGYVPNELQVGQTGKIIAPELYFAFGISGAIQHLAGIKDARVIVAVNTDAEAPIFEVADFGLVGDLFEVIPALEKALE